jgi:hypothetical protein
MMLSLKGTIKRSFKRRGIGYTKLKEQLNSIRGQFRRVMINLDEGNVQR